MKKRFLSTAMALVMAASLLPGTALAAETNTTQEDAILYALSEDGTLEYNVTYSADAGEAAIVDETGAGVDTAEELRAVMGEPDAPAAALGISTEGRTLGQAVTADLTFNGAGDVTTVTITEIRERPVIGISWKKDDIGSDYQGFAEAFERNGALAVFLPQVTSAQQAREVLGQLDGIFMTGGEDWNPSLYGQEQTPHGSSGWNDARDTSDINLMQQAIELDVPMLTVCRGTQGLNVALGGGLIQDVPYYLGQQVQAGEIDESRVTGVLEDTGYNVWNSETGAYEESGCEDGAHYRVQVDGLIHSGGTGYHVLASGENIGIDTNSKWLYDIIGSTSIEQVATAHHQAVDPEDLGEGLTIVARSSDGIVEAVEYQDNLFALGLQWHPERDALEDTRDVDVDQDLSNAPLRALVEYAGIHMDSQEPAENPEPETPAFQDVAQSDWFYNAVQYVSQQGLMSGVAANRFDPNGLLTRGMIAQILYAMEGRPAVAEGAGLAAVAGKDGDAAGVNWAAAQNIVSGTGGNQFSPNSNLTREQMALILYRYAEYKGYDVSQGGMAAREFADSDKISDWAGQAVTWAVNAGLLSGRSGNQLDPSGTATRAEVAQVLTSFMQNVAQ